jgi:adenylate cyclase
MRTYLLRTAALTTTWFVALFYYMTVHTFGVEDIPGVVRTADFAQRNVLVMALVGGIAIGVPYSISDILFDRTGLRKQPYGILLLVKASVQFLITLLAGLTIALTGILVFQNLSTSATEQVQRLLFSKTAILFFTTSFLVSVGINFFQVMQTKIGLRVLVNLLLGRYHSPREEARVFMFLDLRSSTTYAERLGNLRYSSLIQDCFSDLTETLKQHRVEVYQYVGDEAVLTWTVEEGLDDLNCLKAYYHFMGTLQERADYYRARYGVVPEFKAGVNLGVVTVAEVGIVKREIAYLSDVLNTAARIQAMCNELGASLLVSENVVAKASADSSFLVELVDDVVLRGKEQSVKVYSVAPKA